MHEHRTTDVLETSDCRGGKGALVERDAKLCSIQGNVRHAISLACLDCEQKMVGKREDAKPEKREGSAMGRLAMQGAGRVAGRVGRILGICELTEW